MRFGILGPLEVRTDEGRPVPIPELKVRLLLASLLAAGGRAVPSGGLIRDLWEDDPPARPAAALRVKVSQLRRALDAEDGGRDLLRTRPPGYLLVAEDTDARRFRDGLARAHATNAPAAKASLLIEALALWRGAPFADFGDRPFALGAAGPLEEQRLTALEELAEARLALGEHRALVAELTDLAARHPRRERLQAALMLALYRCGRQHEALEHHRLLRDRWREETGLDPGPELADLHQAILRQDPRLRAPAAPAPRGGLPAPLTEVIGRSAAVEEVVSRVGEARLVTLTGPGGVGKTTLALEAARRLRGAFPDGILLVELGTLPRGTGTPEKIAEVVAGAAGLGEGVSAADALADRRVLLILDNCEHVLEPAAEFAGPLLRAGPGPRILATGREPLGIAGERLHAVPPLDVPGPGEADPEALAQVASVRLFTARAAAAAPGFALTRDNAAAVAAVCRRLDGLPLALELAAARVRALGASTLAARLDDRFRLLTAGRRGAPERHRTLRAAMDWSWEPLGDAERAVLRRLAAHAGGCTLEAAEETCSGGGVDAAEVMDVVARLVDRSLVMAADGPGGVRYRLLESVAAYALERLDEAGERDRVTELRDDHYVRLAECAEACRTGHARVRWLARLDAEAANLRQVLESTARRPHRALRLTAALAWYWIERGRAGHARRSLGAALAEAARAGHLDGLAAARTAGDVPAIASALEGLAGAQLLAGRDDHAARLLGTAAAVRDSAALTRRGEGDRILAAARAALGDGAFTGAFRSGRALDPEQAVGGL